MKKTKYFASRRETPWGSHLIHDREKSHKVLAEELELSEERYDAREIENCQTRRIRLHL